VNVEQKLAKLLRKLPKRERYRYKKKKKYIKGIAKKDENKITIKKIWNKEGKSLEKIK
jgi:hypothetical protein